MNDQTTPRQFLVNSDNPSQTLENCENMILFLTQADMDEVEFNGPAGAAYCSILGQIYDAIRFANNQMRGAANT